MKKKKADSVKQEEALEWDYSEGFGGLPEDIDLKHNLGCASDRKKKDSRSKALNENKNQ